MGRGAKRVAGILVGSGVALLLSSGTAHADVVWPALYVAMRQQSLAVIAVGLVTEFLVFLFLLHLSPLRALLATLAANAVTAIAGSMFIAWAGFLYELTVGQLVTALLKDGTFNPVSWTAAFAIAVAVNAIIEFWVLRLAFKTPATWRVFWIIAGPMRFRSPQHS